MKKILTPLNVPLQGSLEVPGDKSISHRAIMFGSLAKGKTVINHFLAGEDCLHTIDIFRQFGVSIEQTGSNVVIESKGVEQFTEPTVPLYFGNSGTTARLMLGILATLPFHTVVYGDPHLTKRPMDRVVLPLRDMGAEIDGRGHDGTLLPLAVRGKKLKGIHYTLPVKSAQVKSALLLAGLFAEGQTTIIEKAVTRDHTENMLHSYGVEITQQQLEITLENNSPLTSVNLSVPGDISSAAFFLVAGAIVPDSNLTFHNVGLNETRTGILDVLKQMGADIEISNVKEANGELSGNISIKQKELIGTTISGDIIPKLIDEIPVVALLATQAEGKTVIKDAGELRVKETDRIHAVVSTLTALGAKVEETDDGMIIYGKTPLSGGEIKSYSDHRMAMMGVIASLIAKGPVEIDDVSAINVSYPDFFQDLQKICT